MGSDKDVTVIAGVAQSGMFFTPPNSEKVAMRKSYPQSQTPQSAVLSEQLKRERDNIRAVQERERGWLKPLS